MMRRLLALAFLSLPLSACVEESPPQEAERAAEEIAGVEAREAVDAERKNIEQAADAAAKLVEAEAQEEIDAALTAESAEGGGSEQ